MMAGIADWIRNIVEWPLRSRQQDLMRVRQSYSKEEFVGFFAARGVEVEVANEVWDIIAENAVVAAFKPRPEDDLLKVFGLADEDLDEDVILELLRRCGCRIPEQAEVVAMSPVETVTDLVDFISRYSQPA